MPCGVADLVATRLSRFTKLLFSPRKAAGDLLFPGDGALSPSLLLGGSAPSKPARPNALSSPEKISKINGSERWAADGDVAT